MEKNKVSKFERELISSGRFVSKFPASNLPNQGNYFLFFGDKEKEKERKVYNSSRFLRFPIFGESEVKRF